MSRELTYEQAVAMAAARKTNGAGPGRPRSKGKRCRCGMFLRTTAIKRGHKCLKSDNPYKSE